MFLSWIDRNVDKFAGTEGANFHLLAPHFEDKLFTKLKTTREEFETKVMTRTDLIAALLMYSDSRYFETNKIKVNGGKVNDIKIVETFQHRAGFKITYIEGLLTKKQITAFMSFALTEFPDPHGLLEELKVHNGNQRNLILGEDLLQALSKMSKEQLVFALRVSQPKFKVNLIALRVTFETGNTYPIIWRHRSTYITNLKVAELDEWFRNAQHRSSIEPIYIRGPVLLDEFVSRSRGIHIYSFGDRHVAGKSFCPGKIRTKMPIDQLIEETIKAHPGRTIDIFVEKDYSFLDKTTPKIEPCYLRDVQTRFRDCLKFDKSKSKYRNARFHYVDIRLKDVFATYKTMWKLGWFPYKYAEIQNDPDPRALEKYFSRAQVLVAEFQIWVPDVRDGRSYVIKPKILQKSKIQKQLDNIKDGQLRSTIAIYFARKIGTLVNLVIGPDLNRLVANTKKTDFDVDREKIFDALDVIYRYCAQVMASFQDFYTLARMFRSYEKSKGGYSSEPARLIILYLGGMHSRDIAKFLHEEIEVSLVQSVVSNKEFQDFQCLEMRSELPLFKYD